MAKKSRRRRRGDVPQMIRHSTGQARVTLNGKTFYLGRYGTAAATTAYGELIARWTKNGRQPLVPVVDGAAGKRCVRRGRSWREQRQSGS